MALLPRGLYAGVCCVEPLQERIRRRPQVNQVFGGDMDHEDAGVLGVFFQPHPGAAQGIARFHVQCAMKCAGPLGCTRAHLEAGFLREVVLKGGLRSFFGRTPVRVSDGQRVYKPRREGR